jgi:tetratricopeptide (TPR) repeat protein
MKMLLIWLFVLTLSTAAPQFPNNQANLQTSQRSALCARQTSLDTINQQIVGTRTFDNALHRIAVLIRAADMLWPHQKEKAMAAFNEAFDLATQQFKETGDVVRRASDSQFAARIPLPDQRYKVITALAKRDPAAARKLSDQITQEDISALETNAAGMIEAKRKNAEKLLSLAYFLVSTDPTTATSFARASLRYTATLQLPLFMYQLAKANKSLADAFYMDALVAYGSSPMDQFLYLSSYPFGNTREAGEMPGWTFYSIPEGFSPNRTLQRAFTQKLLERAQLALESATDVAAGSRWSDASQMWLAFARLEKQIGENLPDLRDPSVQTKDKLFTLLNSSLQRRTNSLIESENRPKKTFDELVEAAEKLTDVVQRDQSLTFAVTGSSKDETVERVISVIDKISDEGVRGPLTNWFYFFRSQALTRDKKFDEARKLATKVTELDQRAYLFSQIAEKSLKESEDQTQVREVLSEIAEAASKAPKTIVAARTLLALAHLYAKLDTNRAIEELANAVRVINALENPDFSQQFVMMKIEGKNFGSYASFSTPGFNPETAFAEISKLDFDGTLSQAASFADKSLRSLTTLAVVEPCLNVAAKPKTPRGFDF